VKRKKNERAKFLGFVLFIIGVVISAFYLDLHNKISVGAIREFISGMGVWAPLVYMLTYVVTSIIIFPSFVLSTASGAIWGAYLGTVYTVIGATLASLFPFFIAKFLGRDYISVLMKGSKIEICDRFISKNGFISVLIARLVPIFPWELVNYSCGICGIHWRQYILGTFLGIIPASFTYNLIGASLGKPLDQTRVLLIFSMAILMVLPIILFNKFWRKKDQTGHSDI